MIFPMVKVLPSTFKRLDHFLPIIDDRRYKVYAIRHFSVPFTIVADVITGVAHLTFLSVKKELTEKDFWEMSHEYFFVYPFQQLIYLLFSTIGTLRTRNYFEGYCYGQWGVIDGSNKAYYGLERIFARVIVHDEFPQYFPGITLKSADYFNLKNLVSRALEFRELQERLKKENRASCITEAEPIYRVFYDAPPLCLSRLEEIYFSKLQEIPEGCQERLGWEKEALAKAKEALEAFFALPTVVKNRLLIPDEATFIY